MSENTPVSEEKPQKNEQRKETIKRPGLIGPLMNFPWWAVVILIVGVLIGFTVLTDVKYIDALTFILDLPWTKESLREESINEDGEWIVSSKAPLNPGKYTLYVEFLDEDDNIVGRTEDYQVKVLTGAEDEVSDPIPEPGEGIIQLSSSKPTIQGTSSMGVKAVLWDDFSKKPGRILVNLWNSEGLFLTIKVTVLSFSFALILGLVFGLMRVSDQSPDLIKGLATRLLIGLGIIILSFVLDIVPKETWKMVLFILVVEAILTILPALPYTISTLYVEVMRGLPMLVIVLYMGFAITPALRDASRGWFIGEIDLRGIPSAIIGLSIGYGAYLSEVFRGGIESIHKGQMEAARSLGMSYFQAMRYVILPQAIRVVLPPLGNDFIALLKDSSLISVIALPELLQRGRLWISRTFRAFEGYNSIALIYLVMTLLLSLLVRVIERRTSID
jgi:ABC-type amino acid transport system permease subunit